MVDGKPFYPMKILNKIFWSVYCDWENAQKTHLGQSWKEDAQLFENFTSMEVLYLSIVEILESFNIRYIFNFYSFVYIFKVLDLKNYIQNS